MSVFRPLSLHPFLLHILSDDVRVELLVRFAACFQSVAMDEVEKEKSDDGVFDQLIECSNLKSRQKAPESLQSAVVTVVDEPRVVSHVDRQTQIVKNVLEVALL